MGMSSQGGHLILRSQAVKGTFQADTITAGVALKLKAGALEPNRDLIIPDPEIGGGRDVNDAYMGAVAWSGDFEFYTRMKALPTLLKACLGLGSLVTTTGVTTHTLTPSDAALLPWLSVQHKVASGLEVFNYTDCVVNSLHLEAEANGYLSGTVNLIARTETAGNTAATSVELAAVDDGSPMTVGTNITVTYNAVAIPAKSFSIDINNNFENDDFKLGSLYLNQISPKRREVSGSFTYRPEDSGLWRQATYGGSALTAPGGTSTKQQMIIDCLTYEDIPASTPPTKYELTMTMPKVVLSPFALHPSGDDLIQSDVSFQAVRPALATPVITCVVKNDKTPVA